MAKQRQRKGDKAAVPAPEEFSQSKPCTLNVGMLIAVPIAFTVGAFATQRVLWAEVIPVLKAFVRLAAIVAAGMAMKQAVAAKLAATRARAEEDSEGGEKEEYDVVKPRRKKYAKASRKKEVEEKEDDDEDQKEEEEEGEEKEKEGDDESSEVELKRPAGRTCFKKGPATLKASREEAAKIKANQNAKAAKLSSKKGHGNDDDDGRKSRTRKNSRMRAILWNETQKALRR